MPMYRAAGLVLLTVLVVGSGGAAAESPIAIEEASLDLGQAVAGATVSATFVLHNRGPDPVRILKAAPS